MNLRDLRPFVLLGAMLALAACDQGRERPPQTRVRVANVAPSHAELYFRREQPPQLGRGATLQFKGATEATYDEDTYDFFVENRAATTWSFAQEVRADSNYVFVLTEDAGEIEPIIIEFAAPAANASDAQIAAVHGGPGLPAVDFYLEPAGVGIAGATPRATLAFQQQLAPGTLPVGDYEVTITTAGNPADVLLTSDPVTLAAGAESAFVVVAESGETTAPLSVLLLQSQSFLLYDRNAAAELRVINGATDTLPRDFAINREFSPPLFAATQFAAPTSHVMVPVAESQPINVTPVGNPGVLELDQTLTMVGAQRSTLLFSGEAGTLTHVVATDDLRRIAGEVKLRFFNAATQFPTTDLLVLRLGDDPAISVSIATLGAPGIGTYIPIPPGDYDLLLRQGGIGGTILAGPLRVTMTERGIYGVMAVNGATTATADIVLLDDFL